MNNNRWAAKVAGGLVLLLASMQSHAGLLSFEWRFADVVGTVMGLTDNTTGPASQVTITAAPGTTFILPQDTIVAGAIVPFNSWTVMSGLLTDIDFLSVGFDLPNDFLDILGGVPGAGGQLFDGVTMELTRGAVSSADPIATPEPASMALIIIGLAALAISRRRFRPG